MQIRKHISLVFTLVGYFVLVLACANPTGPSGGERDTKGPEIIGVIPEPGTLNFNYNEVEFYFDEFLKPGNYKTEIFISPVLSVDPEITVKNKRLKIKFLEPLRENTTYVISLGTGISDFNEGNKMDKSFTYAFSTGGILDSLQFSGKVSDYWSGEPEDAMKIFLFRSSDIEGNEITGIRPEYVCMTDKKGNFDFQYLAAGTYKFYGVSDGDNNFKYSGRGERIALAKDPLIILPSEDSVRKRIEMLAFDEDLKPATVKSAKWSNDFTVHLEFSERIRAQYAGDSLLIEMLDTLGGALETVVEGGFREKNRKHFYFHSPKKRIQDYDIRITNLMDSTGLKGDTTIRLSMLAQVKEERGKFFEKPINLPRGSDLLVPVLMRVPENLDSSAIQLRDSSGVYVNTILRPLMFGVQMRPLTNLDPEMTYKLQIKREFKKPDGSPIDTLVEFKVRFPNPDDFGTISGKVLPDSTRPGARFSVIFRGKPGSALLVKPVQSDDEEGIKAGKKSKGAGDEGEINYYEARFSGPSTFKFVYLNAGQYTIDIIDDEDGNGILTPGSLNPYRMPEKVYHQTTPLEIRAKWDMEKVEIYPIPNVSKGKASKSGLKGGGLGEPEKDPENLNGEELEDEKLKK